MLPRGWFEWDTQLGVQHHRGGFDAAGRRERASERATTVRPRLGLRAGVTPSVELFWAGGMALHLRDGEHWFGLTDPDFGGAWQFVRDDERETSGALTFRYRPAAGREVAELAPSPERAEAFASTDGTPEATLALQLRKRFGGLRLDASVYGRFRAPDRLAATFSSSSDRIDPGDGVGLDVDLLYQAGPAALTAGVATERTQADRTGAELDVDVGGGWRVDLSVGADLSLTRGVELYAQGRWRVRGPTTWVWYDESLSPTWGPDVVMGVLWRH